MKTNQSLNAAVNQARVNCACTVNCALTKDKEYARCATLTDKQYMHRTKNRKRSGEVLFRTGNRIIFLFFFFFKKRKRSNKLIIIRVVTTQTAASDKSGEH